jgi:hypothetical protein
MPELNLRQHLTPAAIARVLDRQPPIYRPFRTAMFAASQTHALPMIALSEITRVVRNVPVVRRGTQAVPLQQHQLDQTYIEPQGIDVSSFVTAAELNNWRILSAQSVQQMVDSKLQHQIQTTRLTTEALCAQAATGTISYPMKIDGGGVDTYEIDYGSTLTFTPGVLWDHEDATIEAIYLDCVAMDELIQAKGYGAQIRMFAGAKVVATCIKLANSGARNNAIEIRVERSGQGENFVRGVWVGGYYLEHRTGGYYNASGTWTKSVADTDICAFDAQAGHGFWFLALDDLDAGLVAMPFFALPENKRNPSGVEIVGRSKPLPAPVVNAICWCTATS